MKKKEAYKILREIDQKTTSTTSIKLGMVTQAMLDKFCKLAGINRSRYIRIAISFFDGYLDSLSETELTEEIKKIKKFD